MTSATPPKTGRKRCRGSRPKPTWCWYSGSQNSSNSQRLAELARERGIAAHLIDGPDIDPAWFEGVETVLVTAGASARRWSSRLVSIGSATGSLRRSSRGRSAKRVFHSRCRASCGE